MEAAVDAVVRRDTVTRNRALALRITTHCPRMERDTAMSVEVGLGLDDAVEVAVDAVAVRREDRGRNRRDTATRNRVPALALPITTGWWLTA